MTYPLWGDKMTMRWLLFVALVVIQAVDTATASFDITVATPKVALSSDALQVEMLVTPAQTTLQEITISTIVDTTGANVVSDLVGYEHL